MNERIGRYHGIPVYKTTIPDYVNGRKYYDDENMFLINGDLIYKNEYFGKLDEKTGLVEEYDLHERATFYTIPKIKVKERGVNFTASMEAPKTEVVSNFAPKDVDTTLAGVYETDYFSSMLDVDKFLAEALK